MNRNQANFIKNDCLEIMPQLSNLFELKNQSIFITGAGGFMGMWILKLIDCLKYISKLN